MRHSRLAGVVLAGALAIPALCLPGCRGGGPPPPQQLQPMQQPPPQTMAPQPVSGTVYITRTGKKFHRANCRSLAKGAAAMDRGQAIAQGYTPCAICNP